MIYRRPDRDPGPYDDDWEGPPTGGPVGQYGGGVVGPLVAAGYGLRCLASGRATIAGRGLSQTVHGPDAAAVGLACLSVAVLLHWHYFWGNVAALAAWAEPGKIVGLLGLIASLAYLLVHLGLLGR